MELKKDIHSIMASKFENIHYQINQDKIVSYPYITYELTFEKANAVTDGVYIDLQIFDYGPSYGNIYAAEKLLRDHLEHLVTETANGFYSFVFLRSNSIKTGDEAIKRLDMQFYVYINPFDINSLRIDPNV